MYKFFTIIILNIYFYLPLGATNTSFEGEEASTFFAPSLKKAYELCDAYVAYQESFLKQEERLIREDSKALIKQSIDFIEPFQSRLKTVCSSEEVLPFLKKLLEARFIFLDSRYRHLNIIRGELANQGSTHLIVGLTHPDRFNQQPEEFKFFAQNSNDNYQMINQLILHMWELVDPKELPKDIKLLVRCSYKIWDNLTNKRTYLGHPDECIFTYDEETDNHRKDWELWNTYLYEQDMEITLLNWTRKKTIIRDTPYMRSTYDQKWYKFGKIGEAPYPEWLKKAETFSEVASPFVNSVNKDNASVKTSNVKKSEKQKNKDKYLSTKKEVKYINSKLLTSEKAPTDEISPITSSYAPVEKSISASEEEEPSGEKLKDSDAEKFSLEKTSTVDTGEEKEEEIDLAPWKNFKKTPKAVAVVAMAKKTISPFEELAKKDQALVEKIFDPEGFNTITFGEFKNLWKRIHGEKNIQETTGSSHKILIASDGRKFPIFAHGDGMRYTKRTIKFLRNALKETGYISPLI